MLRTFNEHEYRPVDSLDGLWDFTIETDRKDRAKLPKRYGRKIHVPSAWEQLPSLENYRGRAWLRTWIYGGGTDKAIRLVFGGVSHTGTVYVDGKQVAHHYDAFTPWDAVIAGLDESEHELVVEVDNSFGPHSALHIENDYYTYGGITRPVEIQLVNPLYIDKLLVTPKARGAKWELDVRVRLKNWSAKAVRGRVIVQIDNKELDLGMVTVKGGGAREVSGVLKGIEAEAWSVEKPTLYEVQAILLNEDNEVTDDKIDRVGFRQVEVKGRKLLLNGQAIRLQGYNRHEDHPQFGCALPVEAMMTDLNIMRDLGCNFIRTCHYPNDMRFLDLCDEMGFYVWEESHARAVPFAHPKFRRQIATSTTEMVEWHYNRPSIIIWGCLNECDSVSRPGRAEHERVLKLLKKLDPSRPITFASNRGEKDTCLGLVDIVSWNHYAAWYGGGLEDVAPRIAKALKWLHSDKSHGGKGKPVIMSEFGAGALYGTRNANGAKWTEEYQRDVLDESLRVYLNHRDIIGATIWQFCDVRITSGFGWPRRPRTMNNKGTVDEYRRPKLAYETVKNRMHEAAAKFRPPPSKRRRSR